MSFYRGIIDYVLGEIAEQEAIDEAADAGYDAAMNMCGNDGQASIIDMTGYDAFYESAEHMAVMAAYADGAAMLISACPYPEAVSEILEEAAGVMAEIISEARGEAVEALLEEMEEEEDEEWWDD